MRRKLGKRTILLLVIWISLLLLTLSLLSGLEAIFNSSPDRRTIGSLIWAGYSISQNFNVNLEVTAIEASWTVPQLNASASDGYSSAWIGIGGENDKTLIQVGTEHDLQNGQETYSAWYETLPAFATIIATLTPSPGDTITASITLTNSGSNTWTIQITDTANGQFFTKNVDYNSTRSSGEWIVERPTINNKISTLSDFGTVSFSNCQITANGLSGSISNFSYSKVQMINQQAIYLAATSNLGADGSSFTVTYLKGQ
jgi:hypothetical protein